MKKIFGIFDPEYTTKQVSDITGFSMLTIRKYINTGIIKGFRKGTRNWIVTRQEVNRFLTTQGRPTLDEVLLQNKEKNDEK